MQNDPSANLKSDTSERNEKIKSLIKENPVMVFMKGTPSSPQCGFSARVCEIFTHLKVKFHFFDVLSDPDIRSGIKEYSNWPTIPQIYVKEQFIGGCDIIQEQFLSGELNQLLSAYTTNNK